MSREAVDVVVVGAGLAGLAAALDLSAAGRHVRLVESGPTVGGRVASDVVDGFTLDRGFQVLNTSYPQVQRRLDLTALDVRALTPGALVRHGDGLHRVGNPLRQPKLAWATATSGLFSVADLVRLAAYSARAAGGSKHRLTHAEDMSAAEAFTSAGLGGDVLERFLRPFLSGVLLERDLSTSRRYVDLVWRSFVRGQSVLPRQGMGAIGVQLAAGLPSGCLQLNTAVQAVDATGVQTGDGRVDAQFVVVAADPRTTCGWFDLPVPPMSTVTTYYHRTGEPPLDESVIVLDGDGGPVINTIVLTAAVPEYAPPGQALISSSVLGAPQPEADVRAHLRRLYGHRVADWELVAAVEVRDALPAYPPGRALAAPARVNGVFLAGDHRATPSLQGALASGTAAARHVLATVA